MITQDIHTIIHVIIEIVALGRVVPRTAMEVRLGLEDRLHRMALQMRTQSGTIGDQERLRVTIPDVEGSPHDCLSFS